ncbi:MAG: hypothetical protein ABJB39_08790 [Chloroflexota bacterium]
MAARPLQPVMQGVEMKENETPRNQEGQPPTRDPKETAQRLDQKADEQEGGSNRARTEDKAREAREGNDKPESGKHRVVGFGG